MKTKILITVLSVLLVSGCVDVDLGGLTDNQGGGVAGNGLEITSFTVEPSTVFEDASIRLNMEIENRGGTTVDANEAMIYLTGSSFIDWSGELYSMSKFIDRTMNAEDVVRGVPASTYTYRPSGLKAPDLEAGQTNNYIFIGRVYSDYQTSANGNIWVYSETEAEAARAAGRQMYTPSFTYSKGPVGLSVSVTPSPVVLYEGGDNRITVYIKVSNLASGTIYDPDATIGLNDVGLTMDQINRVYVDVIPGTGLSLVESEGCEGKQELVAGKDLTLICDLDVSDVDTFRSFPFQVDATYGYYTERTASVTVQGR